MNQDELFRYASTRVLQTPVYRDTVIFPEEIKMINTLHGLLWWLGNTPFPPNSTEEAVATLELLAILSSFNLNDLSVLLEYLSQTARNVSVPSQHSIQAVKDAIVQGDSSEARYLAGRCLCWEVKRWRPDLRTEIADWIARRV